MFIFMDATSPSPSPSPSSMLDALQIKKARKLCFDATLNRGRGEVVNISNFPIHLAKIVRSITGPPSVGVVVGVEESTTANAICSANKNLFVHIVVPQALFHDSSIHCIYPILLRG